MIYRVIITDAAFESIRKQARYIETRTVWVIAARHGRRLERSRSREPITRRRELFLRDSTSNRDR